MALIPNDELKIVIERISSMVTLLNKVGEWKGCWSIAIGSVSWWVGDRWVGGALVGGSVVSCQWMLARWSTCWWAGGQRSVVGGTVEDLLVVRWSVVVGGFGDEAVSAWYFSEGASVVVKLYKLSSIHSFNLQRN